MEKQPKLHVRPDTSRILMSDELRGTVPDLEEEVPEDPNAGQHVVVIAHRRVMEQIDPIVGILRSVLLNGIEPKIEFRVQMKDAMDIVDTPGVSFDGFELHHGERIIKVPGPYIVTAAQIDDISPPDQMCTLGLHLKKPAR